LEKSKANRLEPLRNWILEANALNMAVINNDGLKMKSFLQQDGSNRLLRAQTLTVSFKNPLIYRLKLLSPFVTRQTFLNNVRYGGAKEARTPDLLNAIQALYQLSYDPIHETEPQFIFFSRQVKAFCRLK
jgi:hypothetical protein